MGPPEDLHPTEAISAYLDGAALPEERVRVEEHLRDCARCRDLVEDFRTLSTSAASEEPPPMPSYLATQIRHRIDQAAKRGQRPQQAPFWRSPFALAAAGVAIATLVWVAVRQQMPQPVSLPLLDRDAVQDNAAAAPSSPPEAKGVSGTSPAEKENSDAIMVHLGKDPNRLSSKTSPGGAKKQESPADEKARPDEGMVQGFNEAQEADGNRNSARAEGFEEVPETDEAGNAPRAAAPQAPPTATAEPSEPPESAPTVGGSALGTGPGAGAADSLSGRPRKTYYPSKGNRNEALRQMAKSKDDVGREALLEAPAAGPRSLLYETPDVTVTISQEGVITLVQRGYACSVNVAAPAAEGGKPLAPSELQTLFDRAASRDVAAAATRAEAPEDASQQDKEARSKTLALRSSVGSVIYKAQYGDSAEVAAGRSVVDLEAEIRRMVWTRFRPNLEQRCGPIPGSPNSTP